MTQPDVVIYVGVGCHLCEDATAMLDDLGAAYRVVAGDERYRERIPVIEIDGRIVTEGRVSERAVRAALKRTKQ